MGRSRTLVILAGFLFAGLCLPAAALAGTYSWDLPANFTTTAPGANPDHDAYGATPWSYVEGTAPLLPLSQVPDPSMFTRLPQFATSNLGLPLPGWSDPGVSGALVAANESGGPLSHGAATYPNGQMVLTPALSRAVAIGWTSPLSRSATVSITGTISPADSGSCTLMGYAWSVDQSGTEAPSPSTSNTISASPTVPAGGTVYLTVANSGVYNADCATATVSLHITATETTAPSVTLTSPANGALISGGQPAFSGSASTGFGISPTVTVRIYSGASPTGTPVQTVTTTRSASGGYVVGPNASLGDGQYTAQAEQDDLSSPPDRGLSAPTTFLIHNAAPTITLDSPGSGPLTTASRRSPVRRRRPPTRWRL